MFSCLGLKGMRRILIPFIFCSLFLGFESQHQYDDARFGDVAIPAEKRFARTKYRPSMLTKFVYGFYPYWVYSWEYSPPRWDLLSRIAYFSVVADSQGNIVARRGWPVTSLINEARLNGVSVDLVCALFDNDGSSIHYLLSNSDARGRLAHNIKALLLEAGEGVNIDFETPQAADSLLLPLFIAELRETLNTVNPSYYISVDIPPVDWRRAFKLPLLVEHCDFVFIMAYNYYYSGSSRTGPVAPFDDPTEAYDILWTCENYLSKLGGDGRKLVLGLPLYGFEWNCTGPDRGATTTSTGRAIFYYEAAESALVYGRLWDTNASSPWYRTGSWRQGWYEDAQALDYSYNLVWTRSLMGVGFWAIGYEWGRSEFWSGIENAFTPGGGFFDTLIVDDGDPECQLFGSWALSESNGWENDYRWTSTTYQVDSAVYSPYLPRAGLWRVYIWYRSGSNRATDAVFVVRSIDGTRRFIVDQTSNGSVWNLLGEFHFSSGSGPWVVISDSGCAGSRVVVADAVMFVYVGSLELSEPNEPAEKNELFIFPNPVNDKFKINFVHDKIDEVKVLDIVGRTVLEKSVGKRSNDLVIDTAHLCSGVYFVLVRSSGRSFVKRITILK